MRAIDDRADRSSGRCRTRSRSSARRATCPYPARAPWRRGRSRRDDSLFLALRFHEAQPQLVEHHLEQLPLFCGEVTARLFFEQREDVDHLAGGLQVDLRRLALSRFEAITEMYGGRRREREHEGREIDVWIGHTNVEC